MLAPIVSTGDIMVSMSEQAPAGWYPDGQGHERYWDGTNWTSEVRDLQHAQPTEEQPKKDGAFGKMGSFIRKAASDRQSAKDELQRKQVQDAQAAGALVTSGVFGTSTIEVYEGGYVRVAEGRRDTNQVARITNKTPYEKLRSIKFSGAGPAPQASGFETSALFKGASTFIKGGSSAFKVTAPGLAMTGLSQVAKAKLGKTVLTIATAQRIHTITNEVHNGVMIVTKGDHNDVGLALAEAGDSVLESLGLQPHRTPGGDPQMASAHSSPPAERASAPSVEPSVGDRLRELADLHRDGILSDEEFASAKAKLLGL